MHERTGGVAWSGEGVAEVLRRAVREETRLTCSCGVGPNRLLAKVAADLRKPDGQFVVRPDCASIEHFVTPLPIRKVPGIGKVGARYLVWITCLCCCNAPWRTLRPVYGEGQLHADMLHNYSIA